jgi:hypothetical protein
LKCASKKYYLRREALVWNTRLRMQRRVELAGSDVGLLNGQTTKRDSVASVGGLFTERGFRIGDRVTK